MCFHLTNKNLKKHIMRSEMLNMWHATRGVLPLFMDGEVCVHGREVHPSTNRVQHIQKPPRVYFIPLSTEPSYPLSILLAHPAVDFSPYSWIIRE